MSVPVESGSSSEQVTSDCHQMSLTGAHGLGGPMSHVQGTGDGGVPCLGGRAWGGVYVYGTWARGMGPVQ